MAWSKKDKDKGKKVKNPKVPFTPCGRVVKTQTLPNGSKLNVLCQFNKNVPHGH